MPLFTLQVSPTRTDTGSDVSLYGLYRDLLAYSADWAPIELTPDTVYWLSIDPVNAPTSTSGWFWGAEAGTGNAKFGKEAEYWINLNYDMDFELTGNDPQGIIQPAVPEPTTLALLGLGIAGFWVGRRKVKQKARSKFQVPSSKLHVQR